VEIKGVSLSFPSSHLYVSPPLPFSRRVKER